MYQTLFFNSFSFCQQIHLFYTTLNTILVVFNAFKPEPWHVVPRFQLVIKTQIAQGHDSPFMLSRTFEYESSYVEFVQVFKQWRKTELSRTIIEPFVSSVEYEIKQTNLQIFVVVCLTVFSWEFVKMGSYKLIKWVLLLWK